MKAKLFLASTAVVRQIHHYLSPCSESRCTAYKQTLTKVTQGVGGAVVIHPLALRSALSFCYALPPSQVGAESG